MLMHRAESPYCRVILDNYVPGQRRRISQDALVAHLAVVPDMYLRHQQAPRPNLRNASAARCPPADRHALANRVVVPENGLRRLALVLQILRWYPDRAKRIE